jgi:hypothetical protein
VEQKRIKKGLWAKALAESANDRTVAEAVYIKLRVQDILDDIEFEHEAEAEEQKRRQKERVSISQNDASENMTAIWLGLFLMLIMFFIGSSFL